MNEYNGLLAADLLQNRLGAGQRPTVDCAFSADGLSSHQSRNRKRPRHDTGFFGIAGAEIER
ncbi:MAG: hypothetical protein AB7H90_11185 [Alphaproteobacteria bacterium]